MRMSRKFSPGWVGVGGFQAIYKFPGGSKAYFRKFYYVNLRKLSFPGVVGGRTSGAGVGL